MARCKSNNALFFIAGLLQRDYSGQAGFTKKVLASRHASHLIKGKFFLLLLLLTHVFPAQAQRQEDATIKGVVLSKDTGNPIAAAALTINELGLFTITGNKGEFSFTRVPRGRASIVVQHLGMVTTYKVLDIDEIKTYEVTIEMETSSLRLDEVTVTAQASRSGLSSSSTVSRTAIEHVQATSLSDVLQLIPGQIAGNPNLSSANQIALRQVGTDHLNALGTAIIMDGSPLSNNANLQASNPAFDGASGYAGSVAGRGIDLRQISTENIESIEVIRGIPSVEHGDLTAGALLIETRAGQTPYQFRTRVNPLITQYNIGKGFNLGDRYGNLNVDIDYLESTSDQRQVFRGYDRLTGQLTYSNQFLGDKSLHSTTTLSGFTTVDQTRQDPDDLRYHRARHSKDRGVRFNTTGRWNLGREFAQTLRYNFSVNYIHQEAFNQELLSGYVYPLSFALRDTTMAATIVPSEYISQMTIDGKPLNIFAKITNTFNQRFLGFNHRILMGMDWRTDGNYGEGMIYDVTRPPRMGGNQASRPRAYSDIPALNQIAYYIENNLHRMIGGRELYLQLGLRYDVIQPENPFQGEYGNLLAPRINASFELFNNFKLTGGYGVTAKSPTLLHLYPNPAYFDLVNFNHYAAEPSERLIMVTTRVFDTENKDLQVAKNLKQEVGFDYRRNNRRLTVTAFHEKLTNGYDFYNQVAFVPMEIYRGLEFPYGQPPILDPEPERLDTFIARYNRPMNTQESINRGIEFDLDLGRISAIRTSFNLNGAYIHSRRYSTDHYLWVNISMPRPQRVAVFPKGMGSENTRFNTALRIIHNIPEFQFVVSVTVQTIWMERAKSMGYDDLGILEEGTPRERAVLLPVAYIGKDGQWVYLNRQQALEPQYSDIRTAGSDFNRTMLDYPPLWLFNIRLSKDIRDGFGFAFYVNNMFMHSPIHYNQRSRNYVRRNPSVFFGTEMYIRF